MGSTPILIGIVAVTVQSVLCWALGIAVCIALIMWAWKLLRKGRLIPVQEHVTEVVRLIEAQESSAARDEALELAKKLRVEIDETPAAVRLARQIKRFSTTAHLGDITRQIDEAITKLTNEDYRRPVRFLPILLLLIAVWIVAGPLPMYFVHYVTYTNQEWAARLFPVKDGDGDGDENSQASPMKEFFETTGTIGDTYGAINSLFTAAALAGAIYSIILQTRELALQRDEMVMTRKELSRSAEAQSRSEGSLEAQAIINGLHYLAEFEQYRSEQAEDVLERRQARGKQRAHLTKLERQLHWLGRPLFESERLVRARQDITSFNIQLMLLHEEYLQVRGDALDAQQPLGPVEAVMYDVAEEIEVMHQLCPGPPAALLALTSASNLIGQVVRRLDIQPEMTADQERRLQIDRCDQCFQITNQIVEAMRNPAAFPTDEAVRDFLMHGHEAFLPPAAEADQSQ